MTMATSQSRGTFASWLADQVTRPDTDPIGWLARLWKSKEGPDRPKVSSPTGIVKYLTTLNDEHEWQDYLNQAINAAIEARQAGEQAQSLADHSQRSSQATGGGQPRPLDAPGEVMELRTGDLAGQLMAPVPPTENEQSWAEPQPAQYGRIPPGAPYHTPGDLPDGVSAADATYLAHQLGQIQTQLGIVMQMLAVSNPAAAQVLLEQLSDGLADDPAVATGQVDPQVAALSIAQANGWVPADQPPTPSADPAGGFEQWWGVADPAGESGG